MRLRRRPWLWGATGAGMLWLAGGTPVRAAGPPTAEPELGPRNYTQRAANKIRQGSLLKSEGAEVRTVYVDLQGELGHWRDMELGKHYARLAEIDVIAELAAKHHDVGLAERVETVRRKETERFFGAMQELRVRCLTRPTGTP